MSDACEFAGAWLKQMLEPYSTPPPDHLITHIRDCPHCSVALIALVAQMAGVSTITADLDCETVEEELAGFVDFEQQFGPNAAARAFPEIWWHTLVCPTCDQTYRALQELVIQPEAPHILPASQPTLKHRLLTQINLPMVVFRRAINANVMLGARMGNESAEVILTEDEAEEVSIQLFLRHDTRNEICLVVRTEPPIQGVVVLSVADISYRAPIDCEGVALFSDLPQSLFTSYADAPLNVSIELASG